MKTSERIGRVALMVLFLVIGALMGYYYVSTLQYKEPPAITKPPPVPDTTTTKEFIDATLPSNKRIKVEQLNLKRDAHKIKTYPVESLINLYVDLLYRSDTLAIDTLIRGKDTLRVPPRFNP